MINVVNGDITEQIGKVDAVVNAANVYLAQGGGVCGAIFGAAGKRKTELDDLCRFALTNAGPKGLKAGDAIVTPFPGSLTAIIHAIAPNLLTPGKELSKVPTENNIEDLKRAYWTSLDIAEELGFHSIAFPLLGAGFYGWPQDLALKTAKEALSAWVDENVASGEFEIEITLVLFTPKTNEEAKKH